MKNSQMTYNVKKIISKDHLLNNKHSLAHIPGQIEDHVMDSSYDNFKI